jgi:hypothetical protein
MAATAALAGAAGAGVLGAPAAHAAGDGRTGPAPAEEHCVVHVVGRDDATGELRLSELECAATRRAALERSGVDALAADFAIGVHFDGLGYTGSTLTVVGADCTGGWLNVPAAWDNRISSTLNGCPRIRHFDGANLTGTQQTTLAPGANLTTLNNKSSSLQYLP